MERGAWYGHHPRYCGGNHQGVSAQQQNVAEFGFIVSWLFINHRLFQDAGQVHLPSSLRVQ
jgi:hypothetical protein